MLDTDNQSSSVVFKSEASVKNKSVVFVMVIMAHRT